MVCPLSVDCGLDDGVVYRTGLYPQWERSIIGQQDRPKQGVHVQEGENG